MHVCSRVHGTYIVILPLCDEFAETSIVPSEVEGQTLEVPRGQLRKIQFTVTYIPNGIMYRPGLQINGIRFNIEGHDLLNRRLLSIVRRSCDDSDKPGETCELLQVTVNGTNEQISELDDERLQFFVMGVGFSLVKTSESITLRIVGEYHEDIKSDIN